MLLRDIPRPTVRHFRAGEVLARQSDPDDELFVLVGAVLLVDVDGDIILWPWDPVLCSERAVLHDGRRSATLIVATRAKVIFVPASLLDRERFAGLANTTAASSPYAEMLLPGIDSGDAPRCTRSGAAQQVRLRPVRLADQAYRVGDAELLADEVTFSSFGTASPSLSYVEALERPRRGIDLGP